MVETYAGWKRSIINRLISFDIDGTLEIGDPPGLIPLDAVRRAIALGFVVGSCSDRPLQNPAGALEAAWGAHALLCAEAAPGIGTARRSVRVTTCTSAIRRSTAGWPQTPGSTSSTSKGPTSRMER